MDIKNVDTEFSSTKTKYLKSEISFGHTAIQTNQPSFRFSISGLSINKIVKIINGNKKQTGYKIALWNCGRGLLQNDGTGKLTEIQQFIEINQPHCFGVVESDLFGINSQANRIKYSTTEIHEKLKIDGYRLELPSTWEDYGQARIICYVSEEIKYSRVSLNDGNDQIPYITLLIGNELGFLEQLFIITTENGKTV